MSKVKLIIYLIAALVGPGVSTVFGGKAVIDTSVSVIEIAGKAPTIVVDGTRGRYDEVVTKNLDFYLILKGRKPENGYKAHGVLSVEESNVKVDDVLSHEQYLVQTPVYDLRGWRAVNQRVSPIQLCNDELSYQKGEARKKFLKQGGVIWRHSAYELKGYSMWLLDNKPRFPGAFNPLESRKFEARTRLLGVNVECRGLKRPRATTTTGTMPLPAEAFEKATREKFKNKPVSATLSVTPKNYKRAGQFMCPTKLLLFGRINGNREFNGSIQLSIKKWKSKKKLLQINQHGISNIQGNYPLQWNLGGKKSKSKNVNIQFLVKNKNNKVVQTISQSHEVTCNKLDKD